VQILQRSSDSDEVELEARNTYYLCTKVYIIIIITIIIIVVVVVLVLVLVVVNCEQHLQATSLFA